jgi:hypothetical protein
MSTSKSAPEQLQELIRLTANLRRKSILIGIVRSASENGPILAYGLGVGVQLLPFTLATHD